MTTHRLLIAAGCAALTTVLAAPMALAQAPAAAPAPAAPAAAGYTKIAPAGDLIATLQSSGQFKLFIKGLDATNLTPVVRAQPHLTIFAPTDAAFAAMGDPNALFAQDKLPALQKLLLHHIVNAEIDTTKYKDGYGPIPTGAGDKVVIDGRNTPMKADQANILQTDVHATNGYIDVVDQVLKAGSVPETLPADQAAPPPAAAPK